MNGSLKYFVGMWMICITSAFGQLSPQGQNPGVNKSNLQATRQPAASQPFPPLTAEQTQRLDQLLAAWEASSRQTQRLSCKFTRWQYRPLQAPKDIHATWAKGEVRYQAPAQGMYRVEEMLFFSGFDDKKAPQYRKQPNQPGEWWICTGKELMEFDRANKKCEILELPPQMQGKQIVSSPLPFVFNLNADEMRSRYWIRELPPKSEGEFWLEAWPKHQQDRAEFLKVMVIVKATPNRFLPRALILFPPNFNERTNPERDVYEFTDVERNASLAQKIKEFWKDFIDVTPPADFEVIRNKFVQAPSVATQPTSQTR